MARGCRPSPNSWRDTACRGRPSGGRFRTWSPRAWCTGCPVAGRVPYELLIAPSQPESHGLESDLLAPALRLLAELARRLQRIRGEELVPLNAWLHDGPHWHLEVFPRITRLAGLELGAGVYIDSVAPEDAAAAFRL